MMAQQGTVAQSGVTLTVRGKSAESRAELIHQKDKLGKRAGIIKVDPSHPINKRC
jgi:hypothetical protein